MRRPRRRHSVVQHDRTRSNYLAGGCFRSISIMFRGPAFCQWCCKERARGTLPPAHRLMLTICPTGPPGQARRDRLTVLSTGRRFFMDRNHGFATGLSAIVGTRGHSPGIHPKFEPKEARNSAVSATSSTLVNSPSTVSLSITFL